jgi:hypothetical protein
MKCPNCTKDMDPELVECPHCRYDRVLETAPTNGGVRCAAHGSETLFELEPTVSGRLRAVGEREVRRAKVKEWKAALGLYAYKGCAEDWMALSMPECIARLEGYELTAEEKTDAPSLLAGYCRLLDEAGLIQYGATEYETCAALVGRLGAAGDSASDRNRKSPNDEAQGMHRERSPKRD